MAVVCAYCSGPHVWWDCRKKPEGWKPPKSVATAPEPKSSNVRTPGRENLDAATIAVSASDAGDAGSNPAMGAKRGRGRPKSIDDMRSYKAQKQRDYRARLKSTPT